MELTTPALLFPAISLLMLAYTNRFVVLAQLIRELYAKYKENPDEVTKGQLYNLKRRIVIIKNMQIFGALSFFFCVTCMFLIFFKVMFLADIVFGISLLLLLISLGLLVYELQISINALNIQLKDFE
ncbi:MAG TPA: DUF2721 domain-containing protein [Hungateiclostridium thermocellum]|jgi:hypothetical protein|uniref:DUF2721 domain-containing protein n=2 Tax=Acetivibrio thermocellus TaxID=1515 RepID=A3DIE6_ACET2|nr:DUF2721 domain-containing protein [Acetivibrio thermocellus]CDG36998.1 hypothetical protein CTHBC1_2406 [Acetivibrio thermocellus BC1]ABN53725.1 hypothetical protein Cthe_2523 [Acetivibrio thermocellus ATCC 27405]ADU73203.1 hypothetical protein Clo1313_0106 [Acetivibrio thermocellus DSM 1313]ALX07118.1 Protein of unknown function DUF2721 [Acetivibrio thermocellus AD2]ANV74854.1 Protein of unknown function DUF2721 [Acetivibrio thermocellus DSM 2360]